MPARWKSNYRFLIRAAGAAKSARQEAAAAVARRKAAAAINQKYRARDRGSCSEIRPSALTTSKRR